MTTFDTQLPASFETAHRAIPYRNRAKAALDGFTAMVDALLDGMERMRQRRQLLGLSDSALKDFAANRADAAGEGDKPFWRA